MSKKHKREQKMDKIKEIFIKLKRGHSFYIKGNMAYKMRIEKAFEPFLIELEELGVARYFSQALLFFGKEFVDSIVSQCESSGDSGSSVKDRRRLDQAGLPVTVEDAEKIFDVKANKMSDKEIRESKLAEKSGALVYQSEPMKGDRVGIKVLSKIDP